MFRVIIRFLHNFVSSDIIPSFCQNVLYWLFLEFVKYFKELQQHAPSEVYDRLHVHICKGLEVGVMEGQKKVYVEGADVTGGQTSHAAL